MGGHHEDSQSAHLHRQHGHADEAVKLLKAAKSSRARLPLSLHGTFDAVALEVEFESREAMERGWAEWGRQPSASNHETLARNHRTGGTNEVWILE